MVRRAVAASVPLAAAFLSVVAAQDVVFRTSVDLVTVDATVLDRDGRPVDHLGPDDFVLRVDGRRRPIVSAQFISQANGPERARPLAARHFTSNEFVDAGRLIVVAVDEAHIRRVEGRAAVEAAANFVDHLDPLDRVAVAPLSRVGVVQFTRDRVELRRRLTAIKGQTDPVFLRFNVGLAEAIEIADGGRARLAGVVLRECGRSLSDYTSPARIADETDRGRDACPEQLEQEARAVSQHARTQARISLSALEALVASLKPLDGPKAIVLLSEGMVLDPRLADVSELAALSKDARVTIYGLHMDVPLFEAADDRVSPTFVNDVQMRGDGLARLAGATRGAMFRLVGSDPGPFDRIARELSGYYLLAFEPIDGDRNGRVHRVEVTLARGGGELRARSAFRLPPAAPSADARQEDLVRLLRGTQAATELPVRVATYTYAEPESQHLRLVISTEAEAASGAAAQVLLGYVLTNAQGVIAASGAELAASGRRAFSMVVPAGSFTLRVAGIDPLGRRGLVERPFVAALQEDGGLRLSDLILAPVPPKPELPLQPFIDRVLDQRVTAYVELYASDRQSLRNAEVVFEIASEDGTPHSAVKATMLRRDARWAVARAVVTLEGLTPSRYIARARIIVTGQETRQVIRPFAYVPDGAR